ncbi:MAG TPA: prepilin peptidase [Bryobacteraceae bacterium]|nr:prepilin peptidase [Bryobacteraceae bacterium]
MLTAMLLILGCAAAIDDLRRNRISNAIVVCGLAGGVLYHGFTRGLPGVGIALAGAVVGLTVLMAFYCLGALGGGDVKLMAAFGALLGPSGILLAGLVAAPIGGLWAGLAVLLRSRRRSIPYGPAIVLGAWMAFLGRG